MDSDLRTRYWNYPSPRQAIDVTQQTNVRPSPILRGWILRIVATLISSSTYFQSILWKLHKFDKIKSLQELASYEVRHEPTVVPVCDLGREQISWDVKDLPMPRPRPNDNSHYTCQDYHALYKTGNINPVDVVEFLLALIRRDTSPPGKHCIAFLGSRVEQVVAAAQASRERYRRGKQLSPLDGVPIAVKDEAEITGYSRCLGSRLDFTNPADQTAWCVKMLEEAGGIVIGKTNMHELGLDTTGNNPNFGTTLNPHNPGYYAGGSSGGSAYAVALGLCPIAIGTDSGGSIRIPASFCGIYGLKPTYGRISARPTQDLGSVGVYGPLAASIDDLTLMYRIMAQPDPNDHRSAMFPNSLLRPTTSHSNEVGKRYIGICDEWVNRSDVAILKLFWDAVDFYESEHGYEIVKIALPYLRQSQTSHALTVLSEMCTNLTPDQIRHLTYPNQLILTSTNSQATGQDLLAAQKLRDLMMRHLSWLWTQHPGMIILTPTTSCGGWKVKSPTDIEVGGTGVMDGEMTVRSMEFIFLANWVGCPALSCPMGTVEDDIPAGIMAMGHWGSEEQLLRWGKQSEGLLGGASIKRPDRGAGWVDVLNKKE